MTQVDFYILPDDSIDARLHFTCRLVDKLGKLNKNVFIAAESPEQAKQLDKLLWEIPPESFIPHHLQDSSDQLTAAQGQIPAENVIINSVDESSNGNPQDGVYINLRPAPPASSNELERLVEIVVQDSAVLTNTRQNFKFYRDQGYPIQSHNLPAQT